MVRSPSVVTPGNGDISSWATAGEKTKAVHTDINAASSVMAKSVNDKFPAFLIFFIVLSFPIIQAPLGGYIMLSETYPG